MLCGRLFWSTTTRTRDHQSDVRDHRVFVRPIALAGLNPTSNNLFVLKLVVRPRQNCTGRAAERGGDFKRAVVPSLCASEDCVPAKPRLGRSRMADYATSLLKKQLRGDHALAPCHLGHFAA